VKFDYSDQNGLKTYLLIDEYDNFTNTILADEGQQAYENITQGTGFLRHFFNLLKGATGVTMDDVTSGFNIGRNISLNRHFNETIGFTQAEVEEMLNYYHERGWMQLSVDAMLKVLKRWYNNYYFSAEAETAVYNSDMVLYFLDEMKARTSLPLDLIDPNVKTDYSKLRHLMLIDSRIKGETPKLNGNFGLLRSIIEDGEVKSPINSSFPLGELLNRENFISLLYYFGLLSFTGDVHNIAHLRIPNRTVKDLMYGYMRSSLSTAQMFRVDIRLLHELLDNMAQYGEWRRKFFMVSCWPISM